MFKRVEKRRRRQEKEEELGLDADMKEVLGLQDTDSEESDSSFDGENDNSGSEAGSSNMESQGGQALNSDAEEEGEDEEVTAEVESDESDDEASEKFEIPDMSVTEAVRDPVYLVSLDPDVKACILCPGKLLKNVVMSDIHKSSKAHNRRFDRFVELVSQAGPDANVRDLILAMNASSEKPKEVPLSKRAEKRKEKMKAIKAKRAGRKEKLRKIKEAQEKRAAAAAKSAASKSSASSEPPVTGSKAKSTSSKTAPSSDPPKKAGVVHTKASKAKSTSSNSLASIEPPHKKRKIEGGKPPKGGALTQPRESTVSAKPTPRDKLTPRGDSGKTLQTKPVSPKKNVLTANAPVDEKKHSVAQKGSKPSAGKRRKPKVAVETS